MSEQGECVCVLAIVQIILVPSGVPFILQYNWMIICPYAALVHTHIYYSFIVE